MIKKTCITCGVEFETFLPQKKNCSPECIEAHRKKLTAKNSLKWWRANRSEAKKNKEVKDEQKN